MRIILVGFMGVGKTSLGKKLAHLFNLKFIDLDNYIEHKHKASISFIFNLIGEPGFRTIEHRSLREVLKEDDIVLSTGGGTPCFFDNMQILNDCGFTVYLYLPTKVLLDRLTDSKRKRPLIEKMNRKELLSFIEKRVSEREIYYNKADIKVNVFKLSAKALKEIIIEKRLY